MPSREAGHFSVTSFRELSPATWSLSSCLLCRLALCCCSLCCFSFCCHSS